MGKSEFAAELACRIHGEVVGADAFQIYAGLPLLTAQPGVDLLNRVPHHLIGCVAVEESYHVERYRQEASQRIAAILQRDKIPVVVGGTGLYFRALIQGLAPLPAADSELRRELEQLPLKALVERLIRADPHAIQRIDVRNPRRVLRAIEICELSGRPLEDFRSAKRPTSALHGWVLIREREELRERIAANADRMWERGVVQEVAGIRHRTGATASRAIGFREILALLDGGLDEVQCREAIGAATRRYSKRQLTWFRGQTTFTTLNLSAFNNIHSAVSTVFSGLSASVPSGTFSSPPRSIGSGSCSPRSERQNQSHCS